MENSYGIGVRNRYALFLDDESDPLELLKEKEQEKEQKKKIRVAEKENKVKPEASLKPKQAPPPKKVIKETPVHNKVQDTKREDTKPTQRTNDGKVERSFNKFNNENREERNNRRNRDDRQMNGPSEGTRDREDRPRRDHLAGGENFENRNRGGRTNGNRDRDREAGSKTGSTRGGRNFDNRRGKREFDRQSGSDKTGVKPVEKRDGGGAHNWGSHKDIIEEVDKSNEIDATWGEPDKNDSATSASEIKENAAEPETEPTAPEVEEPKELTLDEWKAQRAGRIKPQYNIRKAGEGEDPSQWKKMYELKKKETEEGLQETDDEEFDASEYPQRVGRQKHVLEIDIHFSDTRRANIGGTGGGRGRGARAGRGGGRPRGDRQQRFRGNEEQAGPNIQEEASSTRNEKAPKVDDERVFPSLG